MAINILDLVQPLLNGCYKMDKEKKMNFNFPLRIDEAKQVKRAQLELSEKYGVKEFYGRALMRGAAALMEESISAPIVDNASAVSIMEIETARRAKKAAAERERRAKKRGQK